MHMHMHIHALSPGRIAGGRSVEFVLAPTGPRPHAEITHTPRVNAHFMLY